MTFVHVGRSSGAATLTLDSPANRNALSSRVRIELSEGIAQAIADPECRSIVIGHRGGVFCAGADLKEAREASVLSPAPSVAEILVAIWQSPKPVIAALSGVARAGGLGIVAACDIVVASTSVTFACNEVRIGVVPAVISAVLRGRMSPPAMHELFLTGETWTAARAANAGLVDSVVEPDMLEGEVDRYVSAFASAAPGALAGTKALTRGPREVSVLRDELDRLQHLSARYFASDEGREGLAAFAERRKPLWSGPSA